MASQPESHPELNGRQRLELALLCGDYEDAARAHDHKALVGALAALIRYAVAEGLTREMFDRRGEVITLQPGYTAVLMATYPDDFEPGCLGHEALTAAGFFGRAPGRAPAA
jgi:hypothetical protein